MSDLKKLDQITPSDVNKNGVVSLAVRPNQSSQYGEGNLSAKELQKRFDQLARLAIGKLNVIAQLLSGEYIPEGSVPGAENESILDYILALKSSENVPDDVSLKELFNRILTEDGQLKAVDPSNGGEGALNDSLENMYKYLNEIDGESVKKTNQTSHRVAYTNNEGKEEVMRIVEDVDGTPIDGFDQYSIACRDHFGRLTVNDPFTALDAVNKRTLAAAIEGISFDKVDEVDEKVDVLSTALTEFKEKVNNILNSDDVTLDQTKEIVAYIKSNKTLIDAITTSKVSVSDIVDDLVTEVSNKPLSAAQGVKLNTSKVSKTYQTAIRVAYINDYGLETTKPITHDYGEIEEKKEANGQTPYGAYSIVCRNRRGAITVANPKGKYDAVNKQTMEAKAESLLSTADERYAKKTDVGLGGGSFTLNQSDTVDKNQLIYACGLNGITVYDYLGYTKIADGYNATLEFLHPITFGKDSATPKSMAFLYMGSESGQAELTKEMYIITDFNAFNDSSIPTFYGYCLSDNKRYKITVESITYWVQPVATGGDVSAILDELHEYAQDIISGVE